MKRSERGKTLTKFEGIYPEFGGVERLTLKSEYGVLREGKSPAVANSP